MDGEKLFFPIGFVAQFGHVYEEFFGNVQDFSVTLEPLVRESKTVHIDIISALAFEVVEYGLLGFEAHLAVPAGDEVNPVGGIRRKIKHINFLVIHGWDDF